MKNNFKESIEKIRMLERSKTLDYVSLEGLSLQTGCEPSDLDTFALKELVDNALDACKGANPTVEVSFVTDKFTTLTVKDNGEGLTEADAKRIIDFERAYSTKFHYKYPTRGALGNALKCVFGIPYALASASNFQLLGTPIKIHSKDKEYNIALSVQELDGQVSSKLSYRDSELLDGTKVSIIFNPYKEDWGGKYKYSDLIRSFAIFNPNANFKITLTHPQLDYTETYPSVGKKRKKFTGASSIHWYSFIQFKQLMEAYIRSIQRGEKDLTLREFIKQFRGLSSDEKISQILKEIHERNNSIQHLSDLARRDDIISQLYEFMKKSSGGPSPDVLGEIGKKISINELSKFMEHLYTLNIRKLKMCKQKTRTPSLMF